MIWWWPRCITLSHCASAGVKSDEATIGDRRHLIKGLSKWMHITLRKYPSIRRHIRKPLTRLTHYCFQQNVTILNWRRHYKRRMPCCKCASHDRETGHLPEIWRPLQDCQKRLEHMLFVQESLKSELDGAKSNASKQAFLLHHISAAAGSNQAVTPAKKTCACIPSLRQAANVPRLQK